jgi:hypothetical protein
MQVNEAVTDLFVLGVIMKKILTPVEKTKAFQLGLIDKNYKNVKKPETKQEKDAISLLDKFIFKLKKILGPKITLITSFLLLMDKEQHGSLITEMNEMFRYSGKYVLWNSELSTGVIGSKENISRYYHEQLSSGSRRFYVFYEYVDFIWNYGLCRTANLRAVDKDGNLYKDISEGLKGDL